MTIVLLESLTFGLGRLAEAAAARGERLCLFTADRSIYRHELAGLSAELLPVHEVDTGDLTACAGAAAALPLVRGVISSTDTWAVPGAELTAQLGLPGLAPDAVRTLRDKARVRALLHAAGLSRAPAWRVEPGAKPPEQARFPLVLKDSAGTSSRAVWLVRDTAEWTAAMHEARQTSLRGNLIAEPYFAGPLYSAETVSWAGQTRLLGVFSRTLSPEPLRREESAAFPVAFPAEQQDLLAGWIDRVLASAGLTDGFAHTEFVYTSDGPEVVEINPRIGGALVGEALCRSLDTNVYSAMIELALGERPALLDAPDAGGGVAFALIYPALPGRLAGWSGVDRLDRLPGTPRWYPTAAVGDLLTELRDQRGCTGIVLADGPTAEVAMHRAHAAAGTITARTVEP